MVGAICFIIFTAPKASLVLLPKYKVVKNEDGGFSEKERLYPVDWDYVARYSIPILLIGGALILTLRGKKK
ncbi:MAG: hypothetical protein JRI96_07425 [Deltaproteobacteria bacterium]|nr:hypothetical protein [Deltaproteobacteria bacterium]